MRNFIKNFANDESGATAIEYGLIAALIAVAIIGTLTLIGPKLDGAFKKVEEGLPEA
ncbi:Flp family type IVb pilin [Brevundimonas sp.]|uniref:Flp family type IVb pilin n=1 Tax=Brevundimonas sp. TaxID=1871086 RepID=UPI00289E5F0C|nr:Flp family type IVb pilin [Brevundimonas sp.]